MSLTVLRMGLDTVEVSLKGSFKPEVIDLLDSKKQLARAKDCPQSIQLGIAELFVQDKAFLTWSWRITEKRFHIVGKRNAAKGSAIAQVRFSAFGLCNEHPEMLWLYIRHVLQELGDFEQLSVSRADVCVDFQGWAPLPEEMKNVVVKVREWSTYGHGDDVETYTWGKRTVLRVYNKTEELKSSKKTWLPELWRQHEDYDREGTVWRVEYQAASEKVTELGIHTVEQLFESTGALLDFGLRWAQLRVPTGDSTKTRWPEDPRWTQLREASRTSLPLQRQCRVAELMSLESVKRRFIGLVATASAYFGTEEFMETLIMLTYAVEVDMMHEDIDFAALSEEKRCRVLSGE